MLKIGVHILKFTPVRNWFLWASTQLSYCKRKFCFKCPCLVKFNQCRDSGRKLLQKLYSHKFHIKNNPIWIEYLVSSNKKSNTGAYTWVKLKLWWTHLIHNWVNFINYRYTFRYSTKISLVLNLKRAKDQDIINYLIIFCIKKK